MLYNLFVQIVQIVTLYNLLKQLYNLRYKIVQMLNFLAQLVQLFTLQVAKPSSSIWEISPNDLHVGNFIETQLILIMLELGKVVLGRAAVHPTVFVTSSSCPLYCLQLLKLPVTFRLRMTRNL